MPSIILRFFRAIEYLIIFSLGKILGITYIVHYLKNPNPLLTVRILRTFGASIGEKTTFKRSLIIDNSFEDQNSTGDFSNLIIGDNCYIGEEVYFDLADKILINNNVIISGRVSINTHADCNRSQILTKNFPRKAEQVIIKNDVWIGFNSTILAGVIINENSVVGSMSLVNKEVELNTFVAGVPSNKIRNLVNN
jgi:acetyltransferase-like isoleucine patch superfamily enzyme